MADFTDHTGRPVLPDYKRPVAYTTGPSVNDQRYYAAPQKSLGPWEQLAGHNSRNFNITNLRSKISGVNQLSKFYFDLPDIRTQNFLPKGISRAIQKTFGKTKDYPLRDIFFYSENITIPMRGINTDPHVYANGFKFEAPIGTNYGDGDIAITMVVDKDYYLYEFFMNWMDQIHDKATGYFSFHDQFITDIDIYQLNNVNVNFLENNSFENMVADRDKGFVNYKVTLGNCFPKSVTAIEFKHDAAGERTKITVGFTYEKIDYENVKKSAEESTININQLRDRYNFAGIDIPPPAPPLPPVGGEGSGPSHQEYYKNAVGVTKPAPPLPPVGGEGSGSSVEDLRRERVRNYNTINQAELDNIITTLESRNPTQWIFDSDSMRWEQNPEWRSEQDIRNAAVEEWFNYTREKLSIDDQVYNQEYANQLADIEANRVWSQYIIEYDTETGRDLQVENPNYNPLYDGMSPEDIAYSETNKSLGVVDIPEQEYFYDANDDFDMEYFSGYMAENISNQSVIDQFHSTLPAGMTPTGNPDRKHQTFDEIYNRLKDHNDSLPDEVIANEGPGMDGGISVPNPAKKTELQLHNEAINELAGYGNSPSNVGPNTIMVPSKNDGRIPVPASIVNDPNPEVLHEYAKTLYDNAGPDIRDFATQKTEWAENKHLRETAHVQLQNNEVSNNLQDLLLNEDPSYSPEDVLHTLPEEMNKFDVDNPQTDTQRIKVALINRLAVGEGTVPLNERETNILLDIVNEQYGLSIPHGTNLYENPRAITNAMRGRGFDQELFVHFQEQERELTEGQADMQVTSVNQATSALNDVVNNINANQAISMLNRAAEHGQQIQDAKDAAQMKKIEEIQENYRQELNSPTRNFWRDMVEQQRQDRIDKGGNPQYTGREQAIMDAADDGKMTSQDLHTFASVLHQEQIDENRVYRTSLEEGFRPEEVGVNAYYNFQAAKQHTNHETTVHNPVITEEERFRIAGKSLAQQLRESQAAAGYASNLDVPTDQLQLMSYLKRYEELGPDERNRVLVVTRAVIAENREN